MLTPEFSLSQDDAMVHLKIRAPYIRAQEVEIDVQGPDFKFYAPPYFLRLSLPASLIEDGREKASFDVGSGWLSLSLPKETTGEEFPDLDLLSRLLASKNESLPSPPVGPQGQLIQDLSLGSVSNDDEGKGDDQEDTKIEFNWDYPQTPVVPSATTETGDILFGQSSKNMYGFNNEYSGAESHLHAMAHEVLEIQSLDASTPASRRLERLAKETRSFDPEHYQGDFLGERDGELSEVLAFRPVTWAALKRIQKTRADNTTGNDLIDPATMTKKEDGSEESCLVLTPEEQTELAQLKYKEYLIQNEASIYLGLVDLIFSYCYNHRTTEGEGTVESPWTLCKVSATLSCFETFHSLKDVVIASTRRSLVYPLHRNWSLTALVWRDVTVLFKLGKRPLLKALLDMRRVLEGDEITYSIARVWLVDYCLWLQSARDTQIRSLSKELHHMSLSKADLLPDLDLRQLETEVLDAVRDDMDLE